MDRLPLDKGNRGLFIGDGMDACMEILGSMGNSLGQRKGIRIFGSMSVTGLQKQNTEQKKHSILFSFHFQQQLG